MILSQQVSNEIFHLEAHFTENTGLSSLLPNIYSVRQVVQVKSHVARDLEASTTQIMRPKEMDISWHEIEAPSTEESAEETDAGNDTYAEKLHAVKKVLTLDGHEPLNCTLQVS